MAQLKPPLTIDEQVEYLKSKGLIIEQENAAKRVLSNINYYRLINAYSLGLYKDNDSDTYVDNVHFLHIYDLYRFDSKLRHIISEPLEQFEINFRTKLAYYLSTKYCATCYLRKELFENEQYYNEFITSINREKKQQEKSPMIKHHDEVYNGILPLWVLVEVLSFGTISKMYANLNQLDREFIAKSYGTDSRVLKSWLRSFVEVRNICAHYGRLYNKTLISRPILFNDVKPYFNNLRVFSVIYLLLRNITDSRLITSTKVNIQAALALYSTVDHKKIGAPDNWADFL